MFFHQLAKEDRMDIPCLLRYILKLFALLILSLRKAGALDPGLLEYSVQ